MTDKKKAPAKKKAKKLLPINNRIYVPNFGVVEKKDFKLAHLDAIKKHTEKHGKDWEETVKNHFETVD